MFLIGSLEGTHFFSLPKTAKWNACHLIFRYQCQSCRKPRFLTHGEWNAFVQIHACSETWLYLTGLAHAVVGSPSCSVNMESDCVSPKQGQLMSFFRVAVIFNDGICLRNQLLCQVQCSRQEPGEGWDGSLADLSMGSSTGCAWFLDGVCLQLLFLWLPGGTEKINELAEHSKLSFRRWLLGGFGSQTGCLPCFCGSQKAQ